MRGSKPVNVLIDRSGDRARPGRVFLEDGVFLIAPTRRGPLARFMGGALNGLFAHLPEGSACTTPST